MAVQIVQKLKDKVELMLQVHPQLRENDARLVANMWAEEMSSDLKNYTASDVFRNVANGVLTSYESISRARRQLQQHNPGLRGKNYGKKQAHQKTVQMQLGYKY